MPAITIERFADNTSMPDQSEPNLSPSRIPSLDGLRALCIAVVVISHSIDSIARDTPGLLGIIKILSSGAFGVLVFFILSGFLITRLLLKEFDRSNTIDLKQFYFRRSLRIFPAFYTYLGVLFILWLSGFFETKPANFIAAATYVWNYKFAWIPTRDQGDGLLDHLWSLSVEEQFYLAWPLTLLLLRPRRAVFFAAIMIALMPISRILTAEFFPLSRSHLSYMTHTNLDNLMFGSLGALLWNDARFQSLLRGLDRCYVPLLSALFIFFAAGPLKQEFGGKYLYIAGLTIEGACNTLIVFWCIRHADTWIGRVLNNRILVHIGVLSYSLYLWQQFFLFYPSSGWPGRFPFSYLCIFAAAECSYWLIERPCLRLRDRFNRPGAKPD